MASGLESEYVTLHEIVKAAKLRLNANIWDYLIGATETETTLRRNRMALDSIAFKPRVLRNVSNIDPSSEILGKKIRLPLMLAPVGSLESFEPGGGITVDTAVYSRRERDIAKRFVKSWRTAATGQDHQAAFSWENFKRVKAKFPDVKFMLKGLGCAEDAEIALQHGVWAVYCSNHGGRQLDHGRGSAAVLPEIVEVAKGKAQIVVDGSFSRGSDIVKAICMGADWVGLGRLYCYGLAANGAAGIERVVELLEEEMKEVMGLLGVTSLKQLDKSYISQGMPTNLPGVHSAFPLLNLEDQGY